MHWALGGDAKLFATGLEGEFTANAEISGNAAYLFQLDNNSGEINNHTISLGLLPSFTWDPTSDNYKGLVYSRYYYSTKSVAPFAEVNTGYRYGTTIIASTGELNSKTKSFVIGSKLGGAFLIGKKVTFDSFFFFEKSYSNIEILDPNWIGDKNSKLEEVTFGLGFGFLILLE